MHEDIVFTIIMISSEPVVIEDDDDEIEFINESGCSNGNPPLAVGRVGDSSSNSVQAPLRFAGSSKPKSSMPQEINGFTKPSYNYCRLITQALEQDQREGLPPLKFVRSLPKNIHIMNI